jgi:UDP:flavonoid glycosyltransferase YjiC (YdhE family)
LTGRDGGGAAPRLRIFLGAFGEPGHAFPMIALASRLAARGHAVMLETWTQWREHVEAAGIEFAAAPEFPVFPTRTEAVKPYDAVALATPMTRATLARFEADVVVHDILTLAPALAGELEGVPVATLVPHLHPASGPGFPPYALGARLPRTDAGRALWERLRRLTEAGLRQGRAELNAARARLGLGPLERLHGGISRRLCMVGTFPQLEYPRCWPPEVHIVGPVIWEPPSGEAEPPPGEDPLVLIAPSTAQDPEHRLLRAALAGLAGEPVRVLAAWNRRPFKRPVAVPSNARLVEWISYGTAMPLSSLVVSHAGHGTLARALACGRPVLAVPHSGDMPENAARADWAGVGVRLPWRFLSPATLRLAVRRALDEPALSARAAQLGAWAATNDGTGRAAALVESLAGEQRDADAAKG